MTTETHTDVVVVGARCAGSPTALLLARRDHRVVVLDRAGFPSDTLSTHVVTPAGVAALRRWGLLDRVVASGCPPLPRWHLDFGPVTIHGTPRPADPTDPDAPTQTYAPRRTVLDALLVDAAREAGAEVREGWNVDAVLREDGRVVGVRAHDHDGHVETIRSRFVVGADGRNSHVAKAVGARQQHGTPRLQYSYFTYFEDLESVGFCTFIRPHRGFAAAPTNDGRTMVVMGWPYAEAADFRADVERGFTATLEMVPQFAEKVRRARRVAPFLGGAVPGFVREPLGPGWALVGDASFTLDPITAQGISHAFEDAEHAATTLDAQLREDPTAYDAGSAAWVRAHEARMPMYEFTAQLATLEPPPPEMQALLGAAADDQAASDGFVSVVAGTVSPAEFFTPQNIGDILGRATAPAG